MRQPYKHPALSQIIFCTGGVCGGKEQAPVPKQALLERWKRDYLWRVCHISFSDCMGPCELANNACLLSPAGARWLGGLESQDYLALADWAAACKQAGQLLPLPEPLLSKEICRFAKEGSIRLERSKS
ncbi:MAG: hypothetical protein RMK51_12410 [Meiothermus sp.]|uniref:hypothetical protein n=1 Tax=Meiothermus sp. TaxID=1955249 RepID=UPI0025F883E2|nr:hypothetical protein [Meiothermus sp.]MCS7068195.1 hypothetical protein [Meiothermus sp.]MCX7739627.1 hypothetical protein [Meiothermus sp.]MDW8426726.1 hypothetical protein [Meiothermus sp.]